MAIYELTRDACRLLPTTNYSAVGIAERGDLQRLLREQIEIVSPETLVISEEFSEWQDSRRRIDLLGVDKAANLVIIELKRTDDGGHMELQALRYAAMVSTMTFERAVTAYTTFLARQGNPADARKALLEFLEWEHEDEQPFAQDVRIVLAGADFSRELTTAVLWLNQRMLDIRCVRLKPYLLDGRVLIDAQQIIPIPEAAEYQVRLRDKEQSDRSAISRQWDEPSLLNAIQRNVGQAEANVATDLLEWIRPKVSRLWCGKGKQFGGVVPIIDADTKYHVFQLTSRGTINFYFDLFAQRPEFQSEAKRREYMRLLDVPEGTLIGPDRIDGRPSIRLVKLTDAAALQRFKAAVTWFLQQVPKPGPADD